MGTRLFTIVCLVASLAATGNAVAAKLDLSAFDLRDVSGLGIGYGHPCQCQDIPDPNALYPTFSSSKPLYSSVRIDMEFGDNTSGVLYRLAIDESGGTGTGYDRLYIDFDRDGDLAEEKPIEPMENPPDAMVMRNDWIAQQVCFACVSLAGEGAGLVEALPRLIVGKKGGPSLTLFPTQARQGEIEIAGRRFDVTMGNVYPIGTRWDRPGTLLQLKPQDAESRLPDWHLGSRLLALHKIGGTYWQLSTTPAGDRLVVQSYQGDFGTFAIGSGKRFVWSKKFGAELLARDRAVLVGKENANGSYESVQACEIPVGDYTPEILAVDYGPLHVSISSNYHVDGKPRGNGAPAYNLRIRKDKPYVLDFSDRPEVLFALPAKQTRIKPGETLMVKAVLVDPQHDIMIRGLRRMPQEHLPLYAIVALVAMAVIPVAAWLVLGRTRQHRLLPVLSVVGLLILGGSVGALHVVNAMLHPKGAGLRGYDELNPRVAILRADGEVVAEGTMPFG